MIELSTPPGSNGRVALVTGAARGIGLGIAAWLISEGWQVVLTDLDRERGSKVAKVLGDNAWFIAMDVSNEGQVALGVAEVLGQFGRLDALVCKILAQRSTQLPAYVDILSRPDLVDASDIKFLTESLKAREDWIVMKGLTLKSYREWLQQGGRWKDQVESRPPDPQLLSILLGGAPSADPEDEGVHKSDMVKDIKSLTSR